jgi:D-xylose transport system ATP-binding protein
MAVAAQSSTNRPGPILELNRISKRFGAVHALIDVDLEIFGGEVVALVGDNGAGKSTLVKTISGIDPPDSGQIIFKARPTTIRGPRDAAALGIATVYQDLALCDNLDVVSNLFLGREQGSSFALNEETMESRAVEALRTLSVRLPSVRTPVASLSGGQRQSVAIARSVLNRAEVILLDEPTAALGVAQTQQVLDLIVRLRQQGLGVLVISHNLAEVFEVADRIVVLRLGRRVADFKVRESTHEQVVAAIIGADVPKVLKMEVLGERSRDEVERDG